MAHKSGEDLEGLGQQAADLWLANQVSTLNQAVVATVKTANLSEEQIRRVTEAANKLAYVHQHEKVGQPHRVIEFSGGPARVAEVLRHLNETPGAREYGDMSDYKVAYPKMAAEGPSLEQLFQVQPTPFEGDPLEPAKKVAAQLEHLLKEADSELSFADSRLEETVYKLAAEIITTTSAGYHLGDVLNAWNQVYAPEPAFVKAAFEMITPHLLRYERFQHPSALGDSIKRASEDSGYANPEDPVVQAFGAFSEALYQKGVSMKVAEDVASELRQIRHFIKNSSLYSAENIKAAAEDPRGLVSKGMDALNTVADYAGKGVSAVAKPFADKGSTTPATLGQYAAKGVKAVPLVAGGLLAIKGLQHLHAAANSPLGRWFKGFIPGTQEHREDAMRTQMAYGAQPMYPY